jgi:CTP synthase (UTP-ammonia lyase)
VWPVTRLIEFGDDAYKLGSPAQLTTGDDRQILELCAAVPDGLVEACELPGYPWIVAVQWHPELTAAIDPTQQGLFDALVKAAEAV